MSIDDEQAVPPWLALSLGKPGRISIPSWPEAYPGQWEQRRAALTGGATPVRPYGGANPLDLSMLEALPPHARIVRDVHCRTLFESKQYRYRPCPPGADPFGWGSRLNDRQILCDTDTEVACCLLLEADGRVQRYWRTTVPVELVFKGECFASVPAFIGEMRDGRTLYVDVFSDSGHLEEWGERRIYCMNEFATLAGAAYAVVTEEIFWSHRCEDIAWFYRHAGGRITARTAEVTWRLITQQANQKLSYGELVSQLLAYPNALAAVCGWILDQELFVDFSGEWRDQIVRCHTSHGKRVSYGH